MPSLNRVYLVGNLTRDPEVRHTPKGTAVGDLGMAINMSYRTAEGVDREEVCYVDVVVWGRQAETCKEYLTKGSMVLVEGRLQLDQWESPEGGKKSKLRVRAERVQFMDRVKSGGGNRGEHRASSHQRSEEGGGYSRPPQHHDDPPHHAPDDDIPF